MNMMNVNWNKCSGDVWCALNEVNLNHNHFDNMMGVYVIWHGGVNPQTVKVGQGFVKDRIAAHRQDIKIQIYKNYGLYVAWASVPANSLNGVEVFLAQQLNPLVGERFPTVFPIRVNLPW